MSEQSEHQARATGKKMSEDVIGMILLFAAIPLIVYIKWVYDDHVLLGALASVILAAAAIFLRKRFD